MNRIWANRLEAGTQKWRDVPAFRKVAVDNILLEDVEAGKITQEQYFSIIGVIAEEQS